MTKDLNTTGRWLSVSRRGWRPSRRTASSCWRCCARAGGERGLVDSDALTMLEGVLEVGDLQVRDIMVPRAQMVFVRRDQPAARILPVVVESGHSRFPVMDEDRDDIVGILLAKDLLRLTTAQARERFDIREYMRPAVFVPESKRLNVLLREFRRNRNHMAIVVDEYGARVGTVHHRGRHRADRRRDRRRVRCRGRPEHPPRRGSAVHGARVTRIAEFNDYFGARLSQAEGFDNHRRSAHEAVRPAAAPRRERQHRRL